MSEPSKRIALPLSGAAEAPPATPAPASEEPTATGVILVPEEIDRIKEQALAALRTCYDPELPANVVDLGLIYLLDVLPNGIVTIDMTLTSPGCPVAGSLVEEVRNKVRVLPGVTGARVNLVWDPPWTRDRMSEAAQLELGLFD